MKQKTRILIYIIIAIAVVIMGTLAILKNHQAYSPDTVQEHIDLGRIYLTELSYEKASLEFTEAIEIEPLNSDAYLGLAEAYVGMGDTEKAIDILEEGYDKTGDERLKDMLEELRPPEETTVTTAVTTEETTTVSTVAMAVVPDLQGLTEEEAIAACETAGLNYSVSYDYSDAVENGYVLSQVIPVNASVAEGISVPFTVSKGVEVVTTVATATPVEEFITIKGVQYSTNLTELKINGISLCNEDIKDLDKMVNLKVLELCAYDYIDSTTGLWVGDWDYYKNVKKERGTITDISVLKNLVKLEELSLNGNEISDISILENLKNLKVLELTFNNIKDIDALRNLSNLTNIDLLDNNVNNISALNKLTKLEYLRIDDNPVSDISPVKDLVNLTALHISGSYNNKSSIDDISVLKNLTKLECFSASYCEISDISVIENFPNLWQLRLRGNKISNITSLKNLTNLKTLQLDYNQISDISALKDLTNLTELYLDDNKISDVTALKNLTKLTSLYLRNNEISDVSALKKLKRLDTLFVGNNPTSKKDIEELEKSLPNLKY